MLKIGAGVNVFWVKFSLFLCVLFFSNLKLFPSKKFIYKCQG